MYGGGTGNTGPTVIGTQASPIYVGTANFPNNQVGYNDFTFDNLSANVKAALTADLNSGGNSEIRFAITPSQGSPVTADWQGNYFFDQPQLTVLAETGASVPAPQVANVLVDGTTWTLPIWLLYRRAVWVPADIRFPWARRVSSRICSGPTSTKFRSSLARTSTCSNRACC